MVAIINTGHSIRSIFNYNENKIGRGQAECIGQGNYPVDVEKMSPVMKLNRLTRQAALNENVTRNSVHISLNFDTSETYLSKEKLMQIADTYMTKIGFGKQPYLVYQHSDSGHPHIHIVSIKIGPDGKRIDMQNIGRNQSETARKEIEKSFGLVVAGEHKNTDSFELKPVSITVAQYGRLDTKRAISTVLSQIIPQYRYSSVAELNAVLNLYNVGASQGSEESRTFRNDGMVYMILGTDKKPIGVAVKASSFFLRPTMKYLEARFQENKTARTPYAKRIKNAIDLAKRVAGTPTFSQLVSDLKAQGITVVERRNTDGLLYGITYVDHATKCVFNGSSLGKQYSAKAILEGCESAAIKATGTKPVDQAWKITTDEKLHPKVPVADFGLQPQAGQNLIGSLMDPEKSLDYVTGQLKGKKKKKKRKGRLDNN